MQLAHVPGHSGWTLLGVDLAAVAQKAGACFATTRRLQLCAHLRVRGAFTSDLVYTPKVPPAPTTTHCSSSPLLRRFEALKQQTEVTSAQSPGAYRRLSRSTPPDAIFINGVRLCRSRLKSDLCLAGRLRSENTPRSTFVAIRATELDGSCQNNNVPRVHALWLGAPYNNRCYVSVCID